MKRFSILLAVALLITAFTIPLNTSAQKNSPGLFDGKTLNGWKRLAGTADFKVEDGAIVGTTVLNSGNSFLVTEKVFGDFILEMDTKIESPQIGRAHV